MENSREGTHMKKETRTVVYDDELRIEASIRLYAPKPPH